MGGETSIGGGRCQNQDEKHPMDTRQERSGGRLWEAWVASPSSWELVVTFHASLAVSKLGVNSQQASNVPAQPQVGGREGSASTITTNITTTVAARPTA